jgi:hypothetical protein
MPQGLGGGIGQLLAAMDKPGAFTSTGSTKTSAGSPSMLSDLVQLGVLGAMLGNVLGGGRTDSTGLSGLSNLGSAVKGLPTWLENWWNSNNNDPGWSTQIAAATGYPVLGSGDQVGMTLDPSVLEDTGDFTY